MEVRAFAKINWDLRILGKRPDGFHELDSIMVTVSLHDRLTFSAADGIVMTCSDPLLPTDSTNLVVKAALLLAQAAGSSRGAAIHLEKNIPAGGGMGGGSSDAASTLLGLNRYWNLNWPSSKLQPLAAELGSDVAFFLYGGWKHCRGRGEIVKSMGESSTIPPIQLLLVVPPLHVSTPLVYKYLNALPWDGKNDARNLTEFMRQIKVLLDNQNPSREVEQGFRNDLTAAAQKVEPGLVRIQHCLEDMYPGRWLMSGSGAVHFVVPRSLDDGTQLKGKLEQYAGPGIRVITATTFTP